MWGVDYRWTSINTLHQIINPRFQLGGLTLCIRILFRELDRGGDRLLSFLCELVIHTTKVVMALVWKRVCEMT